MRTMVAGLGIAVLAAASSLGAESTDPKPLRLGIAGFSHSHVHGILRRKGADVQIVGVAEKNRELAERYLKRYGLETVPIYPSLEEMLAKAKPEAVAGFGPTDEHRAVVEACAPRGIHVMVEKPLAFRADEASAMQALAGRYHTQLLTNLETSWYPSVHAMRALVNDDLALGEIRKVVVHDGHQGPKEIDVEPEFFAWLTDPRAQRRRGAHRLRLLRRQPDDLADATARRPTTVTAVTQQIKPEIYPRVDDEATIVLTYPRAQAILQASWNWPFGRKDMEVYGRAGLRPRPRSEHAARPRRPVGHGGGPFASADPKPPRRALLVSRGGGSGASHGRADGPRRARDQRDRGAHPRRRPRVGADRARRAPPGSVGRADPRGDEAGPPPADRARIW